MKDSVKANNSLYSHQQLSNLLYENAYLEINRLYIHINYQLLQSGTDN